MDWQVSGHDQDNDVGYCWLLQELKESNILLSVCPSVRHGDKLSKALNLYLSCSDISHVSLGPLLGLSQYRRSLKYFVLLHDTLDNISPQ